MKLIDCEFAAVTEKGAVEWARRFMRSGRRGYITTVNVAILMMMRGDQRLKNFISRSALTVCDGQPLVWLSKLLGRPLPERVAGVELVESLCRCAAEEKAGVYLLGSKADIVADVAAKLKEQTPGLNIVGVADGYFGPDESAERAAAVKASGAKLLIVAMGVPRQEVFIEEQWEELGVNLAIPVGGSFDVIAGRKQRAPLWVQKIGFEWFFRMCQEPQRLAKRYVVTNTQFIGLATLALLKEMPSQFFAAFNQQQRTPS